MCMVYSLSNFNPLRSRERRRQLYSPLPGKQLFQSTPLSRAETTGGQGFKPMSPISNHSPLASGDGPIPGGSFYPDRISIHSALASGDKQQSVFIYWDDYFNPLRSRERRPDLMLIVNRPYGFQSTPLSRAETAISYSKFLFLRLFYSNLYRIPRALFFMSTLFAPIIKHSPLSPVRIFL